MVGMGRELYEQFAPARALFDRADEILGYSLRAICLDGPAEQLDATEHSQPALFLTSMAALAWMREHQPETVSGCTAAAGLSLGEYTAMAFAGALTFDDGLRLVRQRGLAMQAASDQVDSGMVSILGWEADQVQELCDEVRQEGEVLQIANFLCPGNIAISGHRRACQQAAEVAEARGAIRAVPLAVAGAFHTPLMEPAIGPLAESLQQTEIASPGLAVISNVDAEAHRDPDDIRRVLREQITSPVRWEDSMRALLTEGYDQFYEVGTGRVLKGLLKRIARKVPCASVP